MSIDFTKPLQLSDGTPLRLLCTDALLPYPVVCLREDTKLFVLFTSDGKRPPGSGSIYLMNAPEQVTIDVWMNVYKDEQGGIVVGIPRKIKEDSIASKLSLSLEEDNTLQHQAMLHIKRTVPVGHVDE